MAIGEFETTPEQLAIGALVALGILIILRDLLRAADQMEMAHKAQEYFDDPNKLAGEALDHLGQDPGVVPQEFKREEESDD